MQRLIENGRVFLNGLTVNKSSILLKAQDLIVVEFHSEPIAEKSNTKADPKLPIEIIHKDEHFLIISKPAHLMVHSPQHESTEFTLIDWILKNHNEIAKIGAIDRPGIIHRLDKDTSGVLILARTNFGHSQFSAMFENRLIHKTYLAIVHGHPEASGIIDSPIGRNKFNKTKMATAPNIAGPERHAITHYKVLEYFDDYSLVELKPITGRTHQIRVHLASIGHPILGDTVYGTSSKLIDRQALHAAAIEFDFSGKHWQFQAPLNNDMESVLKELRRKKS